MKPKTKKMSDEDYFAVGDIFDGFCDPIQRAEELVISASFLKRVYNSNLFDVLKSGKPSYSRETKEHFKFGTALHCYILELDDFYDRFYIDRGGLVDNKKEVLSEDDFNKIEEIEANIKDKYPDFLDGENTEIAVFGEIDGVNAKCKADKIDIIGDTVIITDLKSVFYNPFSLKKYKGERTELIRKLKDLNYDLQAVFYISLIKDIYPNYKVEFQILTASKENHSVQKFKLSNDFLESGFEKLNLTVEAIKDFKGGYVTKEEIL